LHVIPTKSPPGLVLPAGAPARVRLTLDDAALLARTLGVDAPATAGTLDYLIDAYPQIAAAAGRTWLEPTFLVDFDEPPFAALGQDLARLDNVDLDTLEDFVADLIDENVSHAWDVASKVAVRREGDCTEHAVLLAALARMRGIPARIAVGAALVPVEDRYAAFGHAWVELREGDRWVVADAALSSREARYIPWGVLEDEGTGYSLSLYATMRSWIRSVELLDAK
jgi:transglutaminase-like putative cysteine protease